MACVHVGISVCIWFQPHDILKPAVPYFLQNFQRGMVALQDDAIHCYIAGADKGRNFLKVLAGRQCAFADKIRDRPAVPGICCPDIADTA